MQPRVAKRTAKFCPVDNRLNLILSVQLTASVHLIQ